MNSEKIMQLPVLIIDTDHTWTKSLSDYLQKRSYKVDVAITGKESQKLIYRNKYQVVVLDMAIEEHSALEVLRYLKLHAPEIKVIMTDTDSQKLKSIDVSYDDLKRMGASDLVNKPALPDAIFRRIDGDYTLQSWRDIKSTDTATIAEEVSALDEDFTRIKFENFFSGSTTIYDHFVRLGKNKYVKILHEGETFDASRLEAYQESDLDYLYFRTKDRATYINFTNQLLKKMIDKNIGDAESKVKYTQSVVEKYLEQVHTSGLKPQLIDEGKIICENLFNFIKKEKDLYSIMKTYEEYDRPAYAHLFLVSFFSVITCKNLRWTSPRAVEYVALGSMLHDIGHLKLPASIRDKNVSEMNAEELALYRTHPRLGADMLSKYASIPEAVKQIVYQHHEAVNGSGFPNQIDSYKIYPPAKVVALCDEFASFIVEHNLTPLKGIKNFLLNRHELSKFDPEMIKALVSCFIKDK